MIKILLALLISSNSFAGVCDVPVKISVGAPAPCGGYVFSDANELKVRTDLTTKDLQITNLTAQNSVQANMLDIDNKQILVYQSEVKDTRTLSEWEKFAYFGLGVLVTGLVSYGLTKAAGK
jgi:hypothetical protein